MNELLQELDRVYTGIQHLELLPTKHNISIIMDTLTVFEKAYAFIKGHEDKGVSENGRNDSAE